MPDLSFQVESVEAVPFAAVPLLAFRLSVKNAVKQAIHTVALRCQIEIDVTRRRYAADEQEKLRDLFGEVQRWGQTLRNMLWTHASTVVQPFSGSTAVELQVPCTFDFNIAATKYFGGLEDGDIPLCFLFSGTVFYEGADKPLQVAPISWEKRDQIPSSSEDVARTDGGLLPQQRLALPEARRVRSSPPVQDAERHSDLGRSAREGDPGRCGGNLPVNAALIDKIVNAVLYEGYILYPYRASSVKNNQRWNFGVVYPRAYAEAQSGSDSWNIQTECLVAGGPSTVLDGMVRFLRIAERTIGAGPDARPVEKLEVNGRLFQGWQEASECDAPFPGGCLAELIAAPAPRRFILPAERKIEYLPDAAGVIVRAQAALEGSVEVSAEELQNHLFSIRVRISNLTALDGPCPGNRECALPLSFASTHTALTVEDGKFISLLDPPAEFSEAVARCRNIGTWPVLVGIEGQRDTMLSSPIILYDYPQIAPESPGDLFDGTEIDEILTLRIMTMTDEEKHEMRGVDDRARRILERTEDLPEEHFMKLHGVLRSLSPVKAGSE